VNGRAEEDQTHTQNVMEILRNPLTQPYDSKCQRE
jgi:hypothetical protein